MSLSEVTSPSAISNSSSIKITEEDEGRTSDDDVGNHAHLGGIVNLSTDSTFNDESRTDDGVETEDSEQLPTWMSDKRKHALVELIHTERVYVQSLRDIVDGYSHRLPEEVSAFGFKR